jgi:hypothetical protein
MSAQNEGRATSSATRAENDLPARRAAAASTCCDPAAGIAGTLGGDHHRVKQRPGAGGHEDYAPIISAAKMSTR